MTEYVYHFVAQKMPTDPGFATELSLGMSDKYGKKGCELVSITTIPDSNPPGLLLAFQEKIT